MTLPSETGAAFRVRDRVTLVRAAENLTTLEARLDGSLVVVTGGTYTLLGPSGSTIKTGTVVPDGSGVATFTLAAGDLPATLDFGVGYTETWSLTTAAGSLAPVRRSATLARQPLHCPVTQADLEGEYQNISSAFRVNNVSEYIERAWIEVENRIATSGRWEASIVDVDSLHQPTVHLALSKMFHALYALGNGEDKFRRMAEHHLEQFRSGWTRVTWTEDLDQDGVADDDDRVGGMNVVRRASGPGYAYRRRRGGRRAF